MTEQLLMLFYVVTLRETVFPFAANPRFSIFSSFYYHLMVKYLGFEPQYRRA